LNAPTTLIFSYLAVSLYANMHLQHKSGKKENKYIRAVKR